MKTIKCRRCGKEVVHAKTIDADGDGTHKRVLLDPEPRVYEVYKKDGNAVCKRLRKAMVNHIVTCRK